MSLRSSDGSPLASWYQRVRRLGLRVECAPRGGPIERVGLTGSGLSEAHNPCRNAVAIVAPGSSARLPNIIPATPCMLSAVATSCRETRSGSGRRRPVYRMKTRLRPGCSRIVRRASRPSRAASDGRCLRFIKGGCTLRTIAENAPASMTTGPSAFPSGGGARRWASRDPAPAPRRTAGTLMRRSSRKSVPSPTGSKAMPPRRCRTPSPRAHRDRRDGATADEGARSEPATAKAFVRTTDSDRDGPILASKGSMVRIGFGWPTRPTSRSPVASPAPR